MAKKELTFIFENPNSFEETKQLLQMILLETLLSKPVS